MSKWIIKAYSKEKIEIIKRLKELAKEKGVYNLNDIYFSPLSDEQLGFYDANANIIVLDDELIYATEDEIRNVFLHELAHYIQYRYELNADHGKTFHEICNDLGVDSEYAKAKVKLSDRHNKAQKIQKLLALSSSPEAPEAQAALKKAQQLMAQTSVETLDEDIIYETTIYTGLTIPYTIRYVATAAKTISGGYILITRNHDFGYSELQFYGTYEMVETFTYIYDYFTYQLDKDYSIYLDENGYRGSKTLRINYYCGVCNSIITRFTPSQAQKETKDLIVINTQVEETTLGILYPHSKLSKHKASFQYDQEAYAKGQESGNNLQIRRGIRQKTDSKLFLE